MGSVRCGTVCATYLLGLSVPPPLFPPKRVASAQPASNRCAACVLPGPMRVANHATRCNFFFFLLLPPGRYDIGATSGALVSMTSQQWSGTDWYNLSAFQSGLVVSLSLAGALLGSGASIKPQPRCDWLRQGWLLLVVALGSTVRHAGRLAQMSPSLSALPARHGSGCWHSAVDS